MCVAGYHTYFIGHAVWGFAIWSHNANICGPAAGEVGEGAAEAAQNSAGVRPYEADTYGNLRSRSLKGDGLSLDHQPSNASNLARAEAELGRPLTSAERIQIRDQGAAVAVPEELHASASLTYKGRSTPAMIEADAANPLAAATRDSQAMIDAASAEFREAAEAAAAFIRRLAGG
jgi:hypothetical protein